MSTWATLPLGDRTVNFDRQRVPIAKRKRRPGPFPYYGASGVVDHVDDFIFEGLHLLVAEDGENLRSRKTPVAFLADGQFWVNNHAHVLQANSENDIRFLAYALQVADLSAFITGSVQPKLNQSSLSSIPISAPDLDEQRDIADVLGSLDEKLASNKHTISLSEQLLDAYASTLEADSETYPQIALEDVAITSRESTNPKKLDEVPVDHFSIPAFDEAAWPQRIPASEIKSNKLRIRSLSILLSRINPRYNRTWWCEPQSDDIPALASTEFLVLSAGADEDLAALWLAVRCNTFVTELRSRVTGTSGSHQRVRPDDVLAIGVPDVRNAPADLKEQALCLLRLIQQRRAENQRLVRARDALLPELITGRRRLDAVGAEVGP